MQNKYNAFISYKHSELDNRIASDIQHHLERFRIPRSIRKSSKVRKIDRIFRDKEELTLTSDLSTTIENALNNSEHLIVICSKETKNSVWVQREIEFFLKKHSHNDIMTVVTEGEPAEVVPEILQKKVVKTTDANGNSKFKTVPTEFLACDYRGDIKQARKVELPRLVAAMLNCSYDDLVQRQKQYRKKKTRAIISIIGALLLTLTIFFAWSTFRINKNYEESLLNQSNYLASESKKLFDDGDRLSAALLALEALPSEDFNRPVSNKAVNALSQALFAYRPPNVPSMEIKNSFNHEGEIKMFEVNAENNRLAVVHSTSCAALWDLSSNSQINSYSYSNYVKNIAFAPNGDLFLLSDKLYCYDSKNGKEIWSYSDQNNYSGSNFVLSRDGNTLVLNAVEFLLIIDPEDGKIIKTLEMPNTDSDWTTITEINISPNSKYIVGALKFNSKNHIAIWDIESGKCKYNKLELEHIYQFEFIDNTTLSAITTRDLVNTSGSITNEAGMTSHLLIEEFIDIITVNTDTDILWKDSYSFCSEHCGEHIKSNTYIDVDNHTTNALFCAIGNKCRILDTESGELLEELEFSDPIVSINVYDDYLECALSNGAYAKCVYGLKTPLLREFYVDNIELAYVSNAYDIVVQDDSTRAYMYTADVYDDSWQVLKGCDTGIQKTRDTIQIGDKILAYTSYYDEQTHEKIYCFDTSSKSLLWQIDVYNFKSFIPTEENECVILADGVISKLNIKNGKLNPISIDVKISGNNACYTNSKLYFIGEDEKISIKYEYIFSYDLLSGKTERFSQEIPAYKYKSLYAYPDHGLFFLYNTNNEFLLYNNSTIQTSNDVLFQLNNKDYKPKFKYCDKTAISIEDSVIVLMDEQQIFVCDTNLNCKYTIPMYEKIPVDMMIHNGELLVIYDNNTLYRYDLATSNVLGALDIYAKKIYDDFEWNFYGDDRLAIKIDQQLNLIDIEKWELYSHVDFCTGFVPESEIALVLGYTEDTSRSVGYFKIYSPTELIEKAEKLLSGYSLTEKQLSDYGLR